MHNRSEARLDKAGAYAVALDALHGWRIAAGTPVPDPKPILEVLARRPQATPPVWFMRQAGRYLPEYRDLRAKAGSFLDLCFTPELATEVTLQPIRRFGFDAAILFSDILVVPHALGRSVTFEVGEGPRLEPLDDAAKLGTLAREADETVFAPVYEAVRRVKAALPPQVALLGFCGAPWTVATYMVAGRGTPDQAPARVLAYREPDAFARMIDVLVEVSSRYLVAQLKAGDVQAVGAATTRNFFSPIQTIIPWANNFYTQALIDAARDRFKDRFYGFWMLGERAGLSPITCSRVEASAFSPRW